MKTLTIMVIFSLLCLTSCFNCTWVSTGYHYDEDDNYVEDGYYDCPDNNPIISEPITYAPDINIDFASDVIRTTDEDRYSCTVTMNNQGNASAYSVKCKIKVSRPVIPGMMDGKTFEFEKDLDLISDFQKKTFNFGFTDISNYGCCLYSGNIVVIFTDVNGKWYQSTKYFE